MILKIYNVRSECAGIYIHVPFCVTKCPYCDFYSVEGVKYQSGFVKALKVEAVKRSYELEGVPIQSVYFGGGTPSLLSHIEVGEILQTMRSSYLLEDDIEITMECNPGDLSQMDVEKHMAHGVNRFSIGAQSFQPKLLSTLGRRHKREDTIRMYGYFQNLGVKNISLDLIYGIPEETLEDLEADLDQIIAMDPEHISTYHLIYEEGTPFFRALESGQLQEVDEGMSLKMSSIVQERLVEAGYEHYEISNFAKPGRRSRHNSSYWQGIPYIGLGPSAHSYIHPWRSYNPSDVDEYNRQLMRGAGFLNRSYEYISGEVEFEEYLLTRMRTIEGISLAEIKEMGKELDQTQVKMMIDRGWLTQSGDRLRLTEVGINLSDAIILQLSLS